MWPVRHEIYDVIHLLTDNVWRRLCSHGTKCSYYGGPVVQFSRFYFYFSPRAFSASLLALRAFCSSLPLLSPPVFRTCILEFFWTSLLALFEFLPSRFFGVLAYFSDFSPRVFRTSLLAFFGLLSSRFLDFSPRVFFSPSSLLRVSGYPRLAPAIT